MRLLKLTFILSRFVTNFSEKKKKSVVAEPNILSYLISK